MFENLITTYIKIYLNLIKTYNNKITLKELLDNSKIYNTVSIEKSRIVQRNVKKYPGITQTLKTCLPTTFLTTTLTKFYKYNIKHNKS